MADLIGIKKWDNKANGFRVYRLHYTADPKKRTPEWKSKESAGLPKNEWNREYEIDFSSFTGKPVFLHDFDENRMVIPFEASVRWPILRSWDFGYHHPSVSWGQIFDGIQLRILLSDMGDDVDFRDYLRKIQHLSALNFPGREFLDCCDLAGTHKRSTGDNEIKILIDEGGIIPRYRKSDVEKSISLLRKCMARVYRGLPGLIINDIAPNIPLIKALKGGYHYPEKLEGRPEPENPEQDGFYENLVDPLRYMVENFMEIEPDTFKQLKEMSLSSLIPEKELVW